MTKTGSVLGGVLLVGGTCIGAGMLGLPVVTAAAGFYPTLLAYIVIWLLMTGSALAYLEVSLRFKGEINLISMAEKTLGPAGRNIAWITYILFLYSLMAAYTAGGTTMVAHLGDFNLTDHPLEWLAVASIFALPFGFMVYLGAAWVDHVNRILMYGLFVTFFGMCVLAFRIGPADEFYAVGDSKYLLFTVPLLVTSFGYHLLIPTLKSYLNENVKKLRLVILLGSAAPFLIYSLWQLVIMNLIPTWGEHGLVQMLETKSNPAEAIIAALAGHGKLLMLCIAWFSFFALTSSFVGVGLAISDFFADGFHMRKTHKGRMWLSLLTFAPPVLYTILYPRGFIFALTYAGVFAAILLIIFPVTMAWRARYNLKIAGPYKMYGGKPLFVLLLVFGVFVVFADILQRMDVLPVP